MLVVRKYSSKKHEANQKIFIGREGGAQHDFSLKPTRVTPAIDFGHKKEELNLGKSLWWDFTDAFSQEKNKQPLKGGITSSSWTLALLPTSGTNLVQSEKLSG